MRNEEITIPNAVVVASPIVNYSRHATDRGASGCNHRHHRL
ncbi:hypothetical protein ACU4GD_01235 [Cupriavidus basilensis]